MGRTRIPASALALSVALLVACGTREDAETDVPPEEPTVPEAPEVSAQPLWGPGEQLTREQLEAGRHDSSWLPFAELDSAGRLVWDPDSIAERLGPDRPDRVAGEPEAWEDISPGAMRDPLPAFPLAGDVAGPSVLAVQVLLDRARFSPGILDGRWGMNTVKALYWYQIARGLEATGELDWETWRMLGAGPERYVRTQILTPEDVEGPFVTIPEDPYEQEEMECMCYTSLREKLSERFHSTPELLEALNPGTDLSTMAAGDELVVPSVFDTRAEPLGQDVARIVVSGGGHYVHALDERGRLLYHFPSTLGSRYSPSPSGQFAVNAVAWDPVWHYQPDLLEGVPDDEDDAMIPPGPNNAVGVVWMDLTEPHFGIHGTSAPETIGYTTSNGCVRLTNWDARFLAARTAEGTPVEFRDTRPRDEAITEG